MIASNETSFLKHFESYRLQYAQYDTIPDRKKLYYNLREKYRFPQLDQVQESALLLFLLKTNFNGIWQPMKSSGPRYASPAGNMFANSDSKIFHPDHIKEFAEFLKTCIITCESYESTCQWINKGTFMYADPPYRISHATYKGAGDFDDNSQVDLINFLKDASSQGAYVSESNREHLDDTKIKWNMSSGGRHWMSGGFFGPFFPESKWKMVMFTNHKYTAGRKNTGSGAKATEVLIKNY
tara:strand:- start:299 stop:1015 length:717 start_codon:yes stop_codon:yes gene_type:complete